MREALLHFLRCPVCLAALRPQPAPGQDELLSGELKCLQCPAIFRVRDGVPLMLRDEAPVTRTQRSFGKQWQLHSHGSFERGSIYSKTRTECLEDFRAAFSLQDWSVVTGIRSFPLARGSAQVVSAPGF